MGKREILIVLVLLLMFSAATQATSTINTNSSTIEKKYAEGEYVKGRVNMSFTAQENKRFTSNFSGGIYLYDLLSNLSANFWCNPKNCKDTYSAQSGAESKEFSLLNNKTVGMRISGGKIEEIQNFVFNISDLNSQTSCTNQVRIDLFDDGVIDFYNTKASEEVCQTTPKKYGCFESSEDLQISDITKSPYCEKINLTAAPGYKLGAKVRKTSSDGDAKIILELHDKRKEGPSCEITNIAISSTFEEVTCDVVHPSLDEFEAFICVKSNKDAGNFEIREESNEVCGGAGEPTLSPSYLTADFEIFAQPLKFAPLSSLELNKEIYKTITGRVLFADVKSYIQTSYGADCTEECIIPITLSGSSSSVKIDAAKVTFKKVGSSTTSSQSLYDLSEKSYEINLNSTLLDIEKMKFIVPAKNGTHKFLLCFDENECTSENDLISENINVLVGFDFSLGPRSVLVGQKTIFVVKSTKNLSSTVWKFGDNSSIVNSMNNQAEHTYTREGEFTIEITATTKSGETSTKKFKVNVGDAKKSVNLTINKYNQRILDVEADIRILPTWIKDEAEKDFKVTKDEFVRINNEYKNLGADVSNEEYISLIARLLDLKMPYEIRATEKGSLPMAIGFNNINAGYVKEISGDESGDEENLKQSIISWINKNYDGDVAFETYSALYDDGKEELFTTYKIELTPKASHGGEESYLFIDYPASSIRFNVNYDDKKTNYEGAAYIPIDSSGKPDSVEFLIKGETLPEIEELGIFVSPETNNLDIESDKPISPYPWVEEGKILWGRLLISLAILFLVLLVIYLLLQHWYKNSYEKHLFKNPDDLYNLLNFIYNSRKIGMDDKTIKVKLGEKNWKGEQLSYAFKKIDGKRTGMFEIPLFKFVENKKVKQEIEKRQKGPIDTRYIGQK